MKRILMAFVITCFALQYSAGALVAHVKASDSYIRNHVLLLINSQGSLCTGTDVETASHRIVILTAAHCRYLLEKGSVMAVRENGTKFRAHLIAFNAQTDIMLLTSRDVAPITVAKSVEKYEKVHALTHGAGHATWRGDGELLEETKGEAALTVVDSPEAARECEREPNQHVIQTLFDKVCVSDMTNTASTMHVIGGSSGGAVLNEKGEIVGTVSGMSGDGMSWLVPLRHIQEMLAKY
jgi:hypothetical protein